MHCSYAIFSSKFCPYMKGRYSWKKVDEQKKKICVNRLVFLLQTNLQEISEKTVQNGLEKRKNLYLIKLLSKWKMAIRKGHTSFLLFHFCYLKLVLIDSALNSVSGNLICLIFFKNVGVVSRKAAKLENPVKISTETSYVIYSCKTGKCWNQNVFTNLQNFGKFWF